MTRNRATLIAGLGIIIVTNAIALAGVAYNRSGEPDAVLELSERELRMPHYYRMNKENTGLGLRISCRVDDGQSHGYASSNCNGRPVWLDQEKLIELGFDLKERNEDIAGLLDDNNDLPRKVYLVLEYNGAAYRKALADAAQNLHEQQALLANNPGKEEFEKRAEKAQQRLDNEQHRNSRLFAIDAGHDKARLRAAWPDSNRYIVMQALIRTFRNNTRKQKQWKGRITGLLINTINIPLEHRAPFETLEKEARRHRRNKQTPRYKVRVAFGQRAEPWVVSVAPAQ